MGMMQQQAEQNAKSFLAASARTGPADGRHASAAAAIWYAADRAHLADFKLNIITIGLPRLIMGNRADKPANLCPKGGSGTRIIQIILLG